LLPEKDTFPFFYEEREFRGKLEGDHAVPIYALSSNRTVLKYKEGCVAVEKQLSENQTIRRIYWSIPFIHA
jgi:hypothetical protein